MPSALTYTGAWTGLTTDLTPYADTALSPPTRIAIHPNDLRSIPDEIRQMVRLVQDGWGANLGTGLKLDFWSAYKLLKEFLDAYGTAAGIPTRVPSVS